MKRLGWLAATVVLLIVVTLVWVGVRFSGGEPYPAVATEPNKTIVLGPTAASFLQKRTLPTL